MKYPGKPAFLSCAFESKWRYLPITPGNICRAGQKLPGGFGFQAPAHQADFACLRKNDAEQNLNSFRHGP